MSATKLQMGRGDPYDKEKWIEAVARASGTCSGPYPTTAEVHDAVVNILEEEEDSDRTPSKKTTENKLNDLEDEGRVHGQNIGKTRTKYWVPEVDDIHELVKSILEERETATAHKIAQEIDEATEEDVKNVLKDLKSEGVVESGEIGGKRTWTVVD